MFYFSACPKVLSTVTLHSKTTRAQTFFIFPDFFFFFSYRDAAGHGAFVTWCRFEKGVRLFNLIFVWQQMAALEDVEMSTQDRDQEIEKVPVSVSLCLSLCLSIYVHTCIHTHTHTHTHTHSQVSEAIRDLQTIFKELAVQTCVCG